MGLGPLVAALTPLVYACGWAAREMVLVVRARPEDLPKIAAARSGTNLQSSDANRKENET